MSGRIKTLRTLIKRIGDRQLQAFWDLRIATNYSNKSDRMQIREAIRDRIHELRLKRSEEQLKVIMKGRGDSKRLKRISREAMGAEVIELKLAELPHDWDEQIRGIPCEIPGAQGPDGIRIEE